MINKKIKEVSLTRYVITYEDDECTSIWKYDKNKNPYRPVSGEAQQVKLSDKIRRLKIDESVLIGSLS